MEVDKSDDEVQLERLVFGDSEGLKQRLAKEQPTDKSTQQTDLEHLDDDQVFSPRGRTEHSYSSSTLAKRMSTLEKALRRKRRLVSQEQHGTIATTIL
jgi:hypothetical protein